MDEQMTGMSAMAAPRGSAQEESSRVRGRLTALLPLYAAITAAAVMIVFIAVPFHGFLTIVTAVADRFTALFFMVMAIVLVPIALTHALGLRAILTNLQRNGAALAEGEMGALDKLVIGLAILHTAFLALVFMPHIRPSNLLRSVLLAAAAVAVIVTVLFFSLQASSTSMHVLSGYIAIFVTLALIFISRTLAVPMLRVARSLRDKRLSKAVLSAATCGLAAGALILPLASLTFSLFTQDGNEQEPFFYAQQGLLIGLSAILVLLLFLLGPLLRASAAYARLRNADGSAPEA